MIREDWRPWVHSYLIPASPFLYVAVRDAIGNCRHLMTKKASLQVPASEVLKADEAGGLLRLFVGIINDMYEKRLPGLLRPARAEMTHPRRRTMGSLASMHP